MTFSTPRARRRFVLVLLLAGATSGSAVAQWNPAFNGQMLWTDDLVGINTSTPAYRFHVTEGILSPTVFAESTQLYGTAIWGETTQDGTGVYGVATDGNGPTTGVRGTSLSVIGKGVHGVAQANNGVNHGVYGQTYSAAGYSGYFTGGNFYVGAPGFAGINRTWPINNTEAFGITKWTSGWGGMYMNTSGSTGQPYYGYATGGSSVAYHYYHPGSQQWRLNVGGTRLVVNQSNGRVGIRTTIPSYDLHVNGTAGKPGGGSWSNSSDLRLKKDVRDLDGALDTLLALRGVTFEYKDPESIQELAGQRIGVVAQEVEDVFPDWVDEHDGYKRVTFRGFEAVVVEAVRELKEEHESEVRELCEENARLRERLDAIEAALETR